MKRRLPLSPQLAASFSMGLSLIVFESWWGVHREPLVFERAMLLDFALRHPRAISAIVPELKPVVRAHGLHRGDVGDLFARRHFGILREEFATVVTHLLARDLIREDIDSKRSPAIAFTLTERGIQVAGQLSSELSEGLRAVAGFLVLAWQKRRPDALIAEVRHSLPDDSLRVSQLTTPFAPWLLETS